MTRKVTRYLLDSHIVLWALTQPRKLSARTRDILEHEPVYVSPLSIWELLLKHEKGRLSLPQAPLVRAIERAGAHMLSLSAAHVEAAVQLIPTHADPIDRMLLGTARSERMVLMTRDALLLERAGPLLGDLLIEA